MTKGDLAEKLGVSYATLKNWMKGKGEIPASKLVLMSEMFNCSADYLLGIDRKSDLTER